jgi:hypothetical protein
VVALAEVRARARRRLCSGDDVPQPNFPANVPLLIAVAVAVPKNAVAKSRKQAGHWLILPYFGSEVEAY